MRATTKLALILAIPIITACSSESTPTPAATGTATHADSVSFALSCTSTNNPGVFTFRAWGNLFADEYACNGLSSHTCAKYVSSNGHVEYDCDTTNTATQASVPSGCTLAFDSSGASAYYHEFEDGVTREQSAYFCGYLSGAECWYYRAVDGSNEGDLLCVD